MELIKGYANEVKFSVPADLDEATFTVTYGETTTAPASADIDAGVATATIPYAAVVENGLVQVQLDFTYQTNDYTQTKTANVATPYVDIWELRDILGTDTNAWKIEAGVRRIIDSHCDQTFTFSTKTVNVLSNGYDVLVLPERLITFTSMSVGVLPLYDTETATGDTTWLGQGVYTLTGDGWYIRAAQCDWPIYFPDPVIITTNPITNPFHVLSKPYMNGVYYAVTGSWGWTDVPEDVREAARLLVNDYACNESLYRDRYLSEMSAADWAIKYMGGAYSNTGNVRADQLLAPYVKNKWVVV